MPVLLFAAKTFSILFTDFTQWINPFIYLILLILALFLLYFFKKAAFSLAVVVFCLSFLLFDSFKVQKEFEKLNVFSAEVVEHYSRNNKTILILRNQDYKIWAFYTEKIEIETGNQVLAKGSFFPVKDKNYFYSEDFTHTGRIYHLEITDRTVKKNPVTEFFHAYFKQADFPFMYYGFILGERTLMPDKVIDLFKENGCLHILAISGSHIAIIITFLFFIFKLFPFLPKISLVFILSLIWGYLILLDFSPAPMRAIVFTTVLISAKLLERRMSLLDILFLSGWLILLFDPRMIYSLGFLLSFFATFGIIYALPIISKITEQIKNKPLEYLLDGLLIGFFAQLLIFPILLYFFKTLNLMSLFLSIPLTILSTPVLYWSLTGLIFFPFWEKLALLFLPAADLMTFLMLKLMEWTYSVKLLEIKTGMADWIAISAYFPVVFFLWWIKKRWQLKDVIIG